mmetsp:Transcript_49294/g.127126  ORF Transcript_49294/g.127126 Transcript_49294/m.127126 type:complete len:341 (+) Transcript_49294:201-1223(+)
MPSMSQCFIAIRRFISSLSSFFLVLTSERRVFEVSISTCTFFLPPPSSSMRSPTLSLNPSNSFRNKEATSPAAPAPPDFNKILANRTSNICESTETILSAATIFSTLISLQTVLRTNWAHTLRTFSISGENCRSLLTFVNRSTSSSEVFAPPPSANQFAKTVIALRSRKRTSWRASRLLYLINFFTTSPAPNPRRRSLSEIHSTNSRSNLSRFPPRTSSRLPFLITILQCSVARLKSLRRSINLTDSATLHTTKYLKNMLIAVFGVTESARSPPCVIQRTNFSRSLRCSSLMRSAVHIVCSDERNLSRKFLRPSTSLSKSEGTRLRWAHTSSEGTRSIKY